MIDDELLKKFDSIEDLPISEEMLGAYLEGNLSHYESKMVSNEIDSDLNLMNLTHSLSSGIESDLFFNSSLIDSIELPLINDEYQILEETHLEYIPSVDSIDSDYSFDVLDIECDNLDDLDNDIDNE